MNLPVRPSHIPPPPIAPSWLGLRRAAGPVRRPAWTVTDAEFVAEYQRRCRDGERPLLPDIIHALQQRPLPAIDRLSAPTRRLVDELLALARTIVGRPELTLISLYDNTWRFRWDDGVISIPWFDLMRYEGLPEARARLADAYRGLVLHEAAHAALTRCDLWQPLYIGKMMGCGFNGVEDLRIETWLMRRWPGTRPWLALTNDETAARLLARTRPLPSRGIEFLGGLFLKWWTGSLGGAWSGEVREAVERVWPACQRMMECLPGAPAAPGERLSPGNLLARRPLSPAEREGLDSFRRAWTVFEEEIFPVWDRFDAADRRSNVPYGPRMVHLTDVLRESLDAESGIAGRNCQGGASEPTPPGQGGSLPNQPPAPPPEAQRPPDAAPAGPDPLSVLRGSLGGDDAYGEAWRRWHRAIDAVSEELLRHFAAQRERWRGGYASGRRLDLRRAMAGEADPRLALGLWQRRQLPDRCRLALGLLLDRSGSMDGGPIFHAFDALVLLIEVARRLDLPLVVLSFNDAPRREYHSGQPLDRETRRRLGSLLSDCGGGTDLERAVAAALDDVARLPADRAVLIVLSDGRVTAEQRQGLDRRLAQARASGIATIGLGLGLGCEPLAELAFGRTVTGIGAAALVPRLAALVREAVLGR